MSTQAANDQEAKPSAATWASQNVGADTLVKIGGAFAALLYFLGMVALNGYLKEIGATDFAPFNARFVLTGLLVIGPVIAGMVVVWIMMAVRVDSKFEDKPFCLRMFAEIRWRLLLCVWIIAFYLLHRTLSKGEVGNGLLSFVFGSAIVVGVCVFWNEWIALKQPRGRPKDTGNHQIERWERRLWSIIAALFVALPIIIMAYAIEVSSLILPRFDPQIGGARPQCVFLLVDDNQKNGLTSMPEWFGRSIDGWLWLLWDSDRYLVVQHGEYGRIVRLGSDSVRGRMMSDNPAKDC